MKHYVKSLCISEFLNEKHYGSPKTITCPQFLDRPFDNGLYFICDAISLKKLDRKVLQSSFLIIATNVDTREVDSIASFVRTNDPRIAFTKVCSSFWGNTPAWNQYDANWIRNKASFDLNTIKVGNYSIVEENVYLGQNVEIGNFCTIKSGTIIMDNTIIESNCVIGQSGFWFTFNKEVDQYLQLPQTGYVVIKENCHIGSFTNIDRGLNNYRNTIISENVLINDKAHIAHGVQIGSRSKISAGVQLCGEVEIGTDCWVGTGAVIRQMTSIGDFITIGMNSTVAQSLRLPGVYYGTPAKFISE